MAKFDDLNEKIDKLDKKFSNDTEFESVFSDIQDAVADADDNDLGDLADIVAAFRNKLPGRLTINRLRADAKDLDEDLTLDSIDAVLGQIGLRNKALSDLDSALDKESKKAVTDANLLKTIKESIDKVTKTATEIRTLVEKLTESNATAKSHLIALINALDNISSILD